MTSEEEVFNLSACSQVLRFFSLSDTKTNVEQNPHHAHIHHDSLMCQWVAVEDAPEIAWLLDAKWGSMEQIIEEQAHRVQVAALSKCSSKPWRGWRCKKKNCGDLVLC